MIIAILTLESYENLELWIISLSLPKLLQAIIFNWDDFIKHSR